MARLAIVLPVVLTRISYWHTAEDRYAVMHALTIELPMHIAMTIEQVSGEDIVEHLRLLKAQDVRLLLCDQALDKRGARAHRVDVPRSDLDTFAHVPRLACSPRQKKGPRSGGMERGPPSVRHARDSADPGNRGKPR